MKFLIEKKLSEAIYDTIFYTEKYLLILSPFIQLDDYFKNEVFKTHLNNAQVHIIVAFGKNEANINKSFKAQDIEFFTKFPNITIVYIPNLHGKYYGNEKKSIITSMNLIDYSFLNNIEFGVLAEKKLLTSNTFFEASQSKCFGIVEDEGYTIYVKRPKYKKKLLFGKDYVGSEVELDTIGKLIKGEGIEKIKFSEFRNESYVNAALKVVRVRRETNSPIHDISNNNHGGYCIRCRADIPLDTDKPLCDKCYNIWVKFGDPHFSESYCIVCGEEDKSTRSYAKPACYSCYADIR